MPNKIFYLNIYSTYPPFWCTVHSRRRRHWQQPSR